MGILDFHGGIIHQDADGEREAAERHHVGGLAAEAEDHQRSQNRERNRDADDDGAAPASEEEEDHQAGEHGGRDAFADHAVDRGAHEEGLIEELPDLERFRQSGENLGQRGFDVVDDFEGGGLTAAEDGEERAAAAVGAHEAGLHAIAIANLGYVFEVDGGAVDHAQRHVVEFGEDARAAVQLDLVIAVADLGRARREDQVLVAEGGGDVACRESLGNHLRGVEIDHHLAEASAIGERNGGALDRGQLGADVVLPHVEEFLLTHGVAIQAELNDGHARGIVLDDGGRGGAGREGAQQGLRNRGDLGQRQFHFGGGLEVDAGDGNAVVGLGFDVLDIVDGGGH